MKRLCSLLLTCCVIFTACSSTRQTEKNMVSFPVSSTEDAKTKSSSDMMPPSTAVEIKETQASPIQGNKIEADPIRFTQVLGTRKRFENSLPSVVLFEYPYLYYERMSAITEGSENGDLLHVGRYDVESDIKQELGELKFQAMMNDSQLLVDNRYLIYAPCRADDEGQLYLNITLFDLQTHNQKLIFTYPTRNVFVYSKQLNSDEIIFFFYGQEKDMDNRTQQQIIKYSISNDSVTTLHKGELMDWTSEMNSTKDIWTIDVDKNQIYLLLHQLNDGKMTTYLRVLDENGVQLEEQEITALNEYDTRDQTIDSVTVQEDLIFVNYSQFGVEEESKKNAPSAILKILQKDTVLLDIGNTYPKKLLNRNLIENRYLFFSTYSEHPNLLVLDTVKRGIILADLDVNNIIFLTCDNNGNIAAVAEDKDGNNDKIFVFMKEDILKRIEQ